MLSRAKNTLFKLSQTFIPTRFQFTAEKSALVNLFRVKGGHGCTLLVGRKSWVNANIRFERGSGVVKIGARTFIGASSLICASQIQVGDDVLISWGATIVDHDSHSIAFDLRAMDLAQWMQGSKDWTDVPMAPVIISNKVWIGFGATILKGVTVGEGAIVGAASVVTKDVEPWTVVAGNPARVVKRLERSEHG